MESTVQPNQDVPDESAAATDASAWQMPSQPPDGLASEGTQQESLPPHFARLEKLLEEGLEKIEKKLDTMHTFMKDMKDGPWPGTPGDGSDKVSKLKLTRKRSVGAHLNESPGHWMSSADEALKEKRREEDRDRVTAAILRQGSRRSLGSRMDPADEGSNSKSGLNSGTSPATVVRTQVEELLPHKVKQQSSMSLGLKIGTDTDSEGETPVTSQNISRAANTYQNGHSGTVGSSGETDDYDQRARFEEGGRSHSMLTRGVSKGLAVLMPTFWNKVVNRSKRAEAIWTFFEEPESSWAATVYHKVMFVFILVTALIPVLQTLPDQAMSNETFFVLSSITDIVFLLELSIRFSVSPSSLGFFLGVYNLLDMAIIGPFFLRIAVYDSLGSNQDDITPAEGILLCIVPVMRMVKALHSLPNFILLWHTLRSASISMPVPVFMLLMTILIFSGSLYVAEPRSNIISMPHAMYMVAVTISTVGYGDVVPKTDAGRVIIMTLIFVGLLFMAMPIAIVGAAFLETWKNRTRILAVGRIHSRLSQWGYSEEDLRLMFKTFDSDYNEVLDVEEFTRMVETMRLGLNETQVVKLFNVFDADGSGALDMEEFVEGIGLNKKGQMFIIF